MVFVPNTSLYRYPLCDSSYLYNHPYHIEKQEKNCFEEVIQKFKKLQLESYLYFEMGSLGHQRILDFSLKRFYVSLTTKNLKPQFNIQN